MERKPLAIYLNDHLAGATLAVELARQAARKNAGNEFGTFLRWLAQEIDADRRTLRSLMNGLGLRVDPAKQLAAWGSEKLTRLKRNGRLTGYSPLGRLVELEFLQLGVSGKLAMWRALRDAKVKAVGVDLGDLIDRAERQRSDIDRHRLRAAEEALVDFDEHPDEGDEGER